MREERGHLAGDLLVKEPYTLWGSVAGTVTAAQGSKFYLRGTVYGNLNIDEGGRVHILGNVQGTVTLKTDTKVIIGGVIGGDVVNLGGRLYIEATGEVRGRVKGSAGETRIEPDAKATRA